MKHEISGLQYLGHTPNNSAGAKPCICTHCSISYLDFKKFQSLGGLSLDFYHRHYVHQSLTAKHQLYHRFLSVRYVSFPSNGSTGYFMNITDPVTFECIVTGIPPPSHFVFACFCSREMFSSFIAFGNIGRVEA